MKMLFPALLSAFLAVTACSHKKDDKKQDKEVTTASYSTPVTEESLVKMTEEWPQSSQGAIKSLKDKYGLPDSITEEMVVWGKSESFVRSIVYREEVDHQFPMQHAGVLAQTVEYRVPLDKVADLAKFNGSLLVDRTKGEITARNENEAMNILSLNIADKIVRGELTVEQARRQYSENAEAFAAGTSNEMVSKLNFSSEGNTSDPDSMMQSQTEDQPMIKRTIEAQEVKEVIED
jgi:hypothetical protein